jgi:hypothetical protein
VCPPRPELTHLPEPIVRSLRSFLLDGLDKTERQPVQRAKQASLFLHAQALPGPVSHLAQVLQAGCRQMKPHAEGTQPRSRPPPSSQRFSAACHGGPILALLARPDHAAIRARSSTNIARMGTGSFFMSAKMCACPLSVAADPKAPFRGALGLALALAIASSSAWKGGRRLTFDRASPPRRAARGCSGGLLAHLEERCVILPELVLRAEPVPLQHNLPSC